MGEILVCAVTNGSDDVLVRMCKVMATPRGWCCVCVHLALILGAGAGGEGGAIFGKVVWPLN